MQPLETNSVKEWRHRRMLSQQEVADRAGTSLFTIQRIERGEGNVRPKTGRAVAQALDVPIEELLPKAGASPSPEPSFNDVLVEERRAQSWRAWTDYIQATADRWEKEYLNSSEPYGPALARELSYQALALTYSIREGVVIPGFEEIRAGLMDRATETAFRRELAVLIDELNRLSDIAAAIGKSAKQQKAEAQQLRRQREQTRQALRVIEGELAASA